VEKDPAVIISSLSRPSCTRSWFWDAGRDERFRHLTGGVEGQTVWAVIGLIFVANGFRAIAAGVLTTLVVAAGSASIRGEIETRSEK
jgi:hypothetical protein